MIYHQDMACKSYGTYKNKQVSRRQAESGVGACHSQEIEPYRSDEDAQPSTGTNTM